MEFKADKIFLDGNNIAGWNTAGIGRIFFLENVLSLCIELLKRNITFKCVFDPYVKTTIKDIYGPKYLEIFNHKKYFDLVPGGSKADDSLILLLKTHIECQGKDGYIVTNDQYRNENGYLEKNLNPNDKDNYRLLKGFVDFDGKKPKTLTVHGIGIGCEVKTIDACLEELLSFLIKTNDDSAIDFEAINDKIKEILNNGKKVLVLSDKPIFKDSIVNGNFNTMDKEEFTKRTKAINPFKAKK